MKKIAMVLMLLLTGCASQEVSWTGGRAVVGMLTGSSPPVIFHPIGNIEIGLRKDGVLVWRAVEEKK